MGRDSHIIVHLSVHVNSHVNIHVSSHVSNVCDVYFHHRYWAWLGSVGSELFYDSQEMSWIVSIYDRFVKLSQGLICDAQSITLSETICNTLIFIRI
jgi:hypothetical protein